MQLVMSVLKRIYYVVCGFVFLGLQSTLANEYPLRYQYPTLDILSTQEFKLLFDSGGAIAVDVRSQFEYDVLHIFAAEHIPLNDENFQDKVQALQDEFPDKSIVVYCNGKTCAKSYKAGIKCQRANILCLVYDSGIFDWVKTAPEYSAFFGTSPVNIETDLISVTQFQEKLLEPDVFIQQALDSNAMLLDIRSREEQVLKQFPLKGVKKAPLDSDKFIDQIQQAKNNGQNIYLFDSGGKEVQWCMYYLEKEGIQNYYFAKGGVRALDSVILYDELDVDDVSIATSL